MNSVQKRVIGAVISQCGCDMAFVAVKCERTYVTFTLNWCERGEVEFSLDTEYSAIFVDGELDFNTIDNIDRMLDYVKSLPGESLHRYTPVVRWCSVN